MSSVLIAIVHNKVSFCPGVAGDVAYIMDPEIPSALVVC